MSLDDRAALAAVGERRHLDLGFRRSAQPADVDVHPPTGDPAVGEVEERATLDLDLAVVREHVRHDDLDSSPLVSRIRGDDGDVVGDRSEVGLPCADELGNLLHAATGSTSLNAKTASAARWHSNASGSFASTAS